METLSWGVWPVIDLLQALAGPDPHMLSWAPPAKGHLFSFWDLHIPLIHKTLLVTLMDLPGHLSVTI